MIVDFSPLFLDTPLEGFYVKKSVKEHGDKQAIEGNINEKDNILIVDDVITSGGSLFQAVKTLKRAGYKEINMIAAILLRSYDEKRPIDEAGIPYQCIFNEEDFY